MSVARARHRLGRLGLRVETVAVEGCSGTTVAETDPIPGATVRERDLVALFLC
jgi:hypothetical protein